MSLQLNGIRELQRELGRKARAADRDVQNIVRRHGAQLNRKMVQNATFTQGYSTGATRRSIQLQMTNNGMTATVSPGTMYSPYVEYGTRFMGAQPFVRPAFYAERGEFLDSLRRLVR